MEAGPSGFSVTANYNIGKRYLHAKTRAALTLRYIGPLPPESTQATQVWYGVEYDDPAKGKHSGTFEGVQVFRTRARGAGAFIKVGSTPTLHLGKTFVEAVEGRYGPLKREGEVSSSSTNTESIVLGSSGSSILVEAPNQSEVLQRVGRLEKLREIGLEGEWVTGLGGDPDTKRLVQERLKELRTLNLSGNLLSTWTTVAEIVECLPGLRTFVLNESHIDPVRSSLPPETLQSLRSAFSGITELHLGHAGITWQEMLDLEAVLPNLEALYLNDNRCISRLRSETVAGWAFSKLRTLSLDGCGVESWEEVAAGLGHLESLERLNLSSNPMRSIQPPSAEPVSFPTFASLDHLIFLNTALTKWSDIDALESWTSGCLKSLRFSLTASEAHMVSPPDPSLISGNNVQDRPILIAKLSALESLNSTPVSITERRNAERFYLSYVAKILLSHTDMKPSDWVRYHLLCGLHGRPTAATEVKSTALRSKMITLHVYPAQLRPFDISLLASSYVSLLRRKIAKQIQASKPRRVEIWTTRGSEQDREKIQEVPDDEGRAVDWWFNHDDEVVVEYNQ